jgi:DNA excision repair protein ERCC-6
MASNSNGVFPVSKVTRWLAKEKKKIQLNQPAMIASYNKGMGGVDRMDQNVGAYRISMRTKKWWWPFFAFAVDVSVQNGWLLYRMSPAQQQRPMDLLSFKRQIVSVYIKRRVSATQTWGSPLSGRPSSLDKRVPLDIRKDGHNHYLTNGPTRRRCAHCGKKTKLLCVKCKVPCHVECSADFHT